MAAEFPSQPTPTVRGGVVTPERIYVDAAGERVPADSTAPKRLYAHAGATLSESEARRLGVTDHGMPADQQGEPGEPAGDDDQGEPAGGDDENSEAVEEEESHVCGQCDFEAKSAAGLAAHQRTHEDSDE